MYLLLRMAFVALGLWLAARYVPGVHIDGTESLIISALVLAVINAVVDALKEYGVRHMNMPATSQKVWQIIQNSSAKLAAANLSTN